MTSFPGRSFTETSPKWALKMLLIGDAGVGKTDLMCSISDGVLIDGLRSAVGSSFGTRQVESDPFRVKLQIWNLTDKPSFTKLRRHFYRGSAGAIYVFDVSNRSSFKHISKWVKDVHKILGPIPAIIVGNRKDRNAPRQVRQKEGRALANELAIPYLETSAKTTPRLTEALQDMVLAILKDRYGDLITDHA